MTSILVLLAHADPGVRAKYERACAAIPGATVHVRPWVAPGVGMSSLYDRQTAQLRASGGGRVLPGAVKMYAPGVKYDHLVVGCFSGGYAFLRGMSDADRDECAGMFCLDGLHTGFDADGTASDAGLAWATDYALRARDNRCVFWVGHTDVQTPQKGPGAYASTTQTAAELRRLVGESAGGWRVQAFNLRPANQGAQEHGDALHVWGPEWVAGVVAEVMRQRGAPPAPPDTDRSPPICEERSLGELALDIAIGELDAGHNEVPLGSNGGRWVEMYFAGAVRAGKKLGLKAGHWCAGAASWCAFQAAQKLGVAPPHEWRVAVSELVADALVAGAWRSKASGYVPARGDLAILKRGTGDPTKGGIGHVGRVESVDGRSYVTVDGNAGTGWGRATRSLDDPMLVGFVAYPRDGQTCEASPDGLALAAWLRTATDDVADWLDALL